MNNEASIYENLNSDSAPLSVLIAELDSKTRSVSQYKPLVRRLHFSQDEQILKSQEYETFKQIEEQFHNRQLPGDGLLYVYEFKKVKGLPCRFTVQEIVEAGRKQGPTVQSPVSPQQTESQPLPRFPSPGESTTDRPAAQPADQALQQELLQQVQQLHQEFREHQNVQDDHLVRIEQQLGLCNNSVVSLQKNLNTASEDQASLQETVKKLQTSLLSLQREYQQSSGRHFKQALAAILGSALLVLAGVVLFELLVAGPGKAQAENPENGPMAQQIQEIGNTANKTQTSVDETPQKVKALLEKSIQELIQDEIKGLTAQEAARKQELQQLRTSITDINNKLGSVVASQQTLGDLKAGPLAPLQTLTDLQKGPLAPLQTQQQKLLTSEAFQDAQAAQSQLARDQQARVARLESQLDRLLKTLQVPSEEQLPQLVVVFDSGEAMQARNYKPVRDALAVLVEQSLTLAPGRPFAFLSNRGTGRPTQVIPFGTHQAQEGAGYSKLVEELLAERGEDHAWDTGLKDSLNRLMFTEQKDNRVRRILLVTTAPQVPKPDTAAELARLAGEAGKEQIEIWALQLIEADALPAPELWTLTTKTGGMLHALNVDVGPEAQLQSRTRQFLYQAFGLPVTHH